MFPKIIREATQSTPKTFQKELEQLINKYSMERAGGNTPDFILAEYLNMCLTAYGVAVNRRDRLRNDFDKSDY